MGGDTNKLEHHGIKGMRWGVRRQKKRSRFTRPFNDLSEDEQRDAYEIHKKASTHPKYLSTKDLREVVERARLEQEYSRLIYGDAPKKKTADDIKKYLQVIGTGVGVATSVATLIKAYKGINSSSK